MTAMNQLRCWPLLLLALVLTAGVVAGASAGSRWKADLAGVQPLSTISIHKTTLALHHSASMKASPIGLGLQPTELGFKLQEIRIHLLSISINRLCCIYLRTASRRATPGFLEMEMTGMNELRCWPLLLLALILMAGVVAGASAGSRWKGDLGGVQPLSTISIHKTSLALHHSVSMKASPIVLGLQNEDTEWVNVEITGSTPSNGDWVGVFSPAKFNASTCPAEVGNDRDDPPLICTSPVKYQFTNHSDDGEYAKTGKTTLRFRLINQRSDFSFALFTGGLENPKLIAISNTVSFANPKAPLYPRLAQGKSWNEMTVTWTSGYNIDEAVPFVEWGPKGDHTLSQSPSGTLTFSRNDMCGSPARTFGWRHPGYIHTSFLKELWPNTVYTYKLGHQLFNESYVWSKLYSFRSSPYPGQDSQQRIIIFGDMGKAERDGSNEYNNYQPGSLNTTDQLIKDLDNIDIVFHIGDIVYANGYISQWDQFTAQVEPIASTVPYMIASGNHERDWPNTGSFYDTMDSGGECGVLAETMFYVPAENRAKFWYSTDFGMFRFCIADTEHDWREGTEQYKFIEHCLASADRRKQPWLIFAAHRVLGYSSDVWYVKEGTFAEPMGRDSLEHLWQKYRVDIAFYGHVHNYERTCPIYQSQCVNDEDSHYGGTMNGTIHIVAGGGGSHLSAFSTVETSWSLYKDFDYGFVKMTAFNHSSLLFEYKKSSDGKVYDSFTITREYKDILACVHGSCSPTTLAS